MERDPEEGTRRVFLVRGAKKSGKSTFGRTLMNALATKYVISPHETNSGISYSPGEIGTTKSLFSSATSGSLSSHPVEWSL